MFRCVFGERNIGKSAFVENLIKKEKGETLYIATLPSIIMYEEVIARHQKRRPFSWKCVEMFDMSVEEILAYPYRNYQNVMLDNLSYYILFQLYHHKDDFLRKCDARVYSLLAKMAVDNHITFYFVDSPIRMELYEDEEAEIRKLFAAILDKAIVIEHFYGEDSISNMTVREAENYLFATQEESICQKVLH